MQKKGKETIYLMQAYLPNSLWFAGGVDMVEQTINLAKQPHIIVGTPEGLVDHISNMNGFSLHTMKYLVLDEADRLLNEEFEESVDEIMKVIPHERRTSLFSATMTEKVKKLQRDCLRNPVKFVHTSSNSTVDMLKQQYCFMSAKYKRSFCYCMMVFGTFLECYLAYILTEMSGCTSVVFTRNCKATHFLTIMLRHLGLRAIPISGRMSQSNRVGALNQFKAGECNVLICTNAAMRGFDIPSVELVIYYDIPTDVKWPTGIYPSNGKNCSISFCNLSSKKFPEFHCQHEQVLLFMERIIDANKNISGEAVTTRSREKNDEIGRGGGDEIKIKELGGEKGKKEGGHADD
ncbi:dead-box atp-dependent rna helicase 10 [Quercus suber]|uniref:Dead-box atp-dependent rna helicase 10 n=1 Tax=Quercus suber TaxID=58331 RepID=A0AAW0KGE7_QUESU